MSNFDITELLTDRRTDERTDEWKSGHLYRTLLQAGAIKTVQSSVKMKRKIGKSIEERCVSLKSTFDVYVKVSILINYKTKQPSNLA